MLILYYTDSLTLAFIATSAHLRAVHGGELDPAFRHCANTNLYVLWSWKCEGFVVLALPKCHHYYLFNTGSNQMKISLLVTLQQNCPTACMLCIDKMCWDKSPSLPLPPRSSQNSSHHKIEMTDTTD